MKKNNIKDLFEGVHSHEKSLRALLNSIPVPIYYKNVKGFYVECNEAFEKLLNMPRKDIIGKTIFDIAPKEMAEKYHKHDTLLFNTSGSQIYNYNFKSIAGVEQDTIFKKSTFLNEEKEVIGLIGVMTINNKKV